MVFFYGLTYLVPELNTPKPVPLQNVSVETNVVDMIAEVTVTQTYKNEESVTIEAIYKFPIHEAAAICGFEAEIDGNRTVKGIVKEAQQAAKEYDEAIQSGHGAYLLEEELPDVFQCSIGNVTQNQTVKIRITYVTELKQDSDSDQVRFVLPTAVAPRYGDPEKNSSQTGTKVVKGDPTYSSETQYTLDVNVTCRMTASLLSVESPTHKIKTDINLNGDPKTCRVGLAEDRTHLEKDFVLVVKSTDLDKSRAFTEYNPKTKTNCTTLTLVPTFELKPVQTEMIFVIDRSGSMGGAPIIKARKALELILRSLPSNSFFNVVSFGSSYSALFEKSVPYSESSYDAAIQHARIMEADFGGTELLAVLKWVLENKSKELPTAVFLLTDGEVWNVDEIVQLVENKVKEAKDSLRLFSLGIGSSVSHHLVESAARAGKGYAQFVSDEERMDKKVAGMVKNAIRPPLTDYKISWVDTDSGSNEGAVKYRQAPYVIPPLYQGVRCVVYALFARDVEPARSITMTMQSRSGPVEVTVPIDPVILDGSKIHTLAAKKLIQDLEDKKSYLHNDPKNEGKEVSAEDTKKAIVKLAIDANLASRFTSFLAIDERDQTLSTAEIQKRIIPVQARAGLKRRSCASASAMPLCSVAPAPAPGGFSTFFAGIRALGSVSLIKNVTVPTGNRMARLNKKSVHEEVAADTKSVWPDPKFADMETLYRFSGFQSFDGFFKPLAEFFSQGKDKNLFQGKDQDPVWSTCIAMAYLEIVMKGLKDEWELCYEKAQLALNESSGFDSNVIEKRLQDARKLVTEWYAQESD